jgi:formylmethanofuran dehydrogenase subunit E
MKAGIIHWAFDFFGGGEKVAMDIARALGLKQVYTLFSSEKKTGLKVKIAKEKELELFENKLKKLREGKHNSQRIVHEKRARKILSEVANSSPSYFHREY